MTAIKICGLKDSENLRAAIESGADFIGLVFYPDSPRYVSYHAAANLRQLTPPQVKAVGLFVDPDDALLEKAVLGLKLDLIQLHGDEAPERVEEIRGRFQKPVMKAVRIANAKDVQQINNFQDVSDWILVDARVEGEKGGTGKSFDWTLLKDFHFQKPWMLSGGLNAANIAQALNILKPDAVDISSGVEKERGIKDAAKIRTFIETVRRL